GNRVTPSVMPARNKLRVSINRDPSPNVAVAKHAKLFNRDVLVLGINKRPDFVTLKATARQIAKHFVLILGARFAKVGQELDDSILGNTSHSNRGSNAVAFNKGRYYLGSLFVA